MGSTPTLATMEMKTCLEIAARIWCDKEFSHVVMDPQAAKDIAKILFFVAQDNENKNGNNEPN